MSTGQPAVPAGAGKHPVVLVVISANELAASTRFYAAVFGWHAASMSKELTAMMAPAGPGIALRANVPDGFQGVVPFIGVRDVTAMLADVVAAGATVDRAPWAMSAVGSMARFRDPSGTVYGLTTGIAPGTPTPVPMPFGDNPKPAADSICSLEMYAADGAAAGAFFGEQFGWGAAATMPHYVAFDPGVGIGGVFQEHTPTSPGVAYVYVSDVKGTLVAIDAAGGTPMGEPMTMPGMACFGYFTDPSGTMMGLIGP